MTKENRWGIIEKRSEIEHPTVEQLHSFIDGCIIDELMFAGLKAWNNRIDIGDEFEKVLQAYSFEGYEPSIRILNYIKHYSMFPEVAAMQHVELNDYVSYIGEYYDGTPTSKYRKAGRFKIEPIKFE